jgi:hypothetical protein
MASDYPTNLADSGQADEKIDAAGQILRAKRAY